MKLAVGRWWRLDTGEIIAFTFAVWALLPISFCVFSALREPQALVKSLWDGKPVFGLGVRGKAHVCPGRGCVILDYPYPCPWLMVDD